MDRDIIILTVLSGPDYGCVTREYTVRRPLAHSASGYVPGLEAFLNPLRIVVEKSSVFRDSLYEVVRITPSWRGDGTDFYEDQGDVMVGGIGIEPMTPPV